MIYEYLLFNLIILSGPLALSFDRRVHFYGHWAQAFAAIFLTLIPFIVWDALVTYRHWWFNERYTLDVRLLNLPIGEWLFFITVPYTCLFIWEVLDAYFKNRFSERLSVISRLMPGGIPLGVAVFWIGKEYTGLVLIALGVIALLDRWWQTRVFAQMRTYWLLAIVTGLTLIFNGYLTARPVVLYDPRYQLDLRIFTIPVEDFGYGFSLVLLCISVFEMLKGKARG